MGGSMVMSQMQSWSRWAYGAATNAAHGTVSALGYVKYASKAPSVAKNIIYNFRGLYDKKNLIKNADLPASIKQTYDHVQPSVVTSFFNRFKDEPAMLEVNEIVRAVANKVPVVGKTVSFRVGFQAAALDLILWLSRKIEAVIPAPAPPVSTDQKSEISNYSKSLVQGAAKAMEEVENAAKFARIHGKQWEDEGFLRMFTDRLEASETATLLGTPREFYLQIAQRLIDKLQNDLQQPNAVDSHLSTLLNGISQTFTKEQKRDFIAQKLLLIHETITNPTFLKGVIIGIFHNSSSALEARFNKFMVDLEPEIAQREEEALEVVADENAKSYGKAIISFLNILQPKAFGFNMMAVYARLTKGDLAKGKDFLSVLLNDITGKSIEVLLGDSTDEWIKGAVKVTRLKLVDKIGTWIERPGFIPAYEWDQMGADERLQACSVGTQRYEEFKKRHIQAVDELFEASVKRFSQNIFRAGLVIEQNVPTPPQAAVDESRPLALRLLAAVGSIVYIIPIIKGIRALLHRITIWIRNLIADSAGAKTGADLVKRVDDLLKTPAISLIFMSIVQNELERFDLLAAPPHARAPAAADRAAGGENAN